MTHPLRHLLLTAALALLFLARQAGAADIALVGTNDRYTFTSNNVYDGGGEWFRWLLTEDGPPPERIGKQVDGKWYVWNEGAKLTGECNFQPGAQNVKVRRVTGDRAAFALKDGSHRKGIVVEDSVLTGSPPGYFGNNNNAFLIAGTSEGVVIQRNLIREGGYGLISYNSSGIKVLENLFVNRHQWGHLMNVGVGAVLGGNRGWGQKRMCFEVQRHGDGTFARNLVVENNVTASPAGGNAWTRGVDNDSFFLSIVSDGAENVIVRNNFGVGIPHDYAGPWLKTDPLGRRAGMGIEYGAKSGEVYGNVVAGTFAGHVIVSSGGPNANGHVRVYGNKFYGWTPVDWWGRWPNGELKYNWVERESGNSVTIIDEQNVKDPDYTHRPPVPGATQPVPVPPPVTIIPPAIVATSQGPTIKLTISNATSDKTRIERKPGVGDWQQVAELPAAQTEWVDDAFTPQQIASKWVWHYRAIGVKSDGTTSQPSAVKSAQLAPAAPGPTPPPTQPAPTTQPYPDTFDMTIPGQSPQRYRKAA